MAAKKTPCTQRDLIKQMTEAGYELIGFSTKPGTLVIRLTPADLGVKETGNFKALEVCAAAGVHALCRTYSAVGEPDQLIVSAKVQEDSAKSEINNRKSEI